MNMEPAKSIINYLGGARAVAGIVEKHVSRVYRWTYPETTREGTGGLIPAKEQRRILAHCQENGIDLRPEDFFAPDRLSALKAKEKPQRTRRSSVEMEGAGAC